jgi:hypothetical protein
MRKTWHIIPSRIADEDDPQAMLYREIKEELNGNTPSAAAELSDASISLII